MLLLFDFVNFQSHMGM